MSKTTASTTPLAFTPLPEQEMQSRAEAFYNLMQRRRTVREFAAQPVPLAIIESCLQTAGTAPSGANKQPWHFVVVTDSGVKSAIREGAEDEEREFYNHRASEAWLQDLAPLGTDADKPFLDIAPVLIVVFAEKLSIDADNIKHKNYYVTESASIATGFLLAALHNAGLATLTHTPSPMKFLNELLQRPANEKPLMIVVTGYPAANARVPAISRKSLPQFTSYF